MDFAKSLWDLEIQDQSCCVFSSSWIDMLPKCGPGLPKRVQREGERVTELLVLSRGAREKKRDTPCRPPCPPTESLP